MFPVTSRPSNFRSQKSKRVSIFLRNARRPFRYHLSAMLLERPIGQPDFSQRSSSMRIHKTAFEGIFPGTPAAP